MQVTRASAAQAITSFSRFKNVLIFGDPWVVSGTWQKNPRELDVVEEAANGFSCISYSYTYKDENYHRLTSDATTIVSYKYPIAGKQFEVMPFI